MLENEPLVLGALGLAVGAAIGALPPRTQAEDRYLGETSDHLREASPGFGKEKLEQGKAVAEEVYRTAKEKAKLTGLMASGEDSLVGKVGEVARATMEKARESAGEAGLVSSARGPQGAAARLHGLGGSLSTTRFRRDGRLGDCINSRTSRNKTATSAAAATARTRLAAYHCSATPPE